MSDVVGKLWGFCHTLRHDGIDYGDYIEQLRNVKSSLPKNAKEQPSRKSCELVMTGGTMNFPLYLGNESFLKALQLTRYALKKLRTSSP
jgi:hypothetical protein